MSDKRAKIEAMMAKKRAADEQRGLTPKGAGSSRGTSTSSTITSRVEADVDVLGPPRVSKNNNTYLDVAVRSVNAGEGKGRALVPAAGLSSPVGSATSEQKPLFQITGVKVVQPPKHVLASHGWCAECSDSQCDRWVHALSLIHI